MTLNPSRIRSLRRKLERAYDELDVEVHRAKDPLGLIDPSLPPHDFEILSFLAAGISYGRVEQIQKSFCDLLLRLRPLGLESNGKGIYTFLRDTEEVRLLSLTKVSLKGWVHRLNTSEDLIDLFLILSRALKNHSSLAQLYLSHLCEDPEESLIRFSQSLNAMAPLRSAPKKTKGKWRGTGAGWFFANPNDGSSCKRLLMWLRWMCRKDAVDPGTWRELVPEQFEKFRPDKNYIFWPVDTHILQWALQEGLVQRKTSSWALVKELSLFARQLCPEDPIKYDFAICHSGMLRFRASVKGPHSKPRRESSSQKNPD